MTSPPLAATEALDARSAARRRLRRALDVVRSAVRTDALWRPGDVVVLGCSAGVDSIVAWELLARLRRSLGHALHVVQVDHGLRDDADAVAAALDAMAARHGDPWARIAAPVDGDAAQLEANARLARYAAMERVAAQLGAPVIAIAHHADDQAETVLMRLARGAGLSALGAMRSDRDGLLGHEDTAPTEAAVRVVRPLLDLRRTDIVALAVDLGLRWVDDPHNHDTRHERNRLRHELLPRLEAIRPGASTGIVRSARHAADAADALGFWLDVALTDHGRWLQDDAQGAPGAQVIGLELPARLVPPAVAPLGVLLAAVARALGAEAPSDRATRQVLSWRRVATPGSSTEIHGLRLEHRGEFVAIVRRDVARLPRGTYLGDGGSRRAHAPPPRSARSRDDAPGSSGSRSRARSTW